MFDFVIPPVVRCCCYEIVLSKCIAGQWWAICGKCGRRLKFEKPIHTSEYPDYKADKLKPCKKS